MIVEIWPSLALKGVGTAIAICSMRLLTYHSSSGCIRRFLVRGTRFGTTVVVRGSHGFDLAGGGHRRGGYENKSGNR
jgi:hypothetical protein